ncbi:hypothetical protein LEMLEM_LOCUS25011 [Lemmus lemmus]
MSPVHSDPGVLTVALFLRRPILRSRVPSAAQSCGYFGPKRRTKRQDTRTECREVDSKVK